MLRLVLATVVVSMGLGLALWGGPLASSSEHGGEPARARYLALGGGALPESTEVSLEQDIALAQRVLEGRGVVLFGGGPGSRSVRVLRPATEIDERDLRLRLGDVFAPRVGRRSRYRESELVHTGPASRVQVEAELSRELGHAASVPLLMYVAAHGEQGESPADNRVVLWGGEGLTVRDLARIHQGHRRPLHAVMTSCFSGGFADLAFEGADPSAGPTRAPRCGLFAGPWDRRTSGCDPDPDRRRQDSYGIHMLNALRGRDRHGEPLAAAAVDLDGDGRISLLEGHTRARIASHSIDVPTTTSERYLRVVQAETAASRPGAFPEEDAVLVALGRDLNLSGAAAAEARLGRLRDRIAEADTRLGTAEEQLDQTYWDLATLLLSRFPVLDDAYHPEFPEVLRRHARTIEALLDDSEEGAAYYRASAAVLALEQRLWDLQVREARVLRYARASETRALAAGLAARGGPDHAAYARLLACERFAYGDAPATPAGP